MRTPELGTSRKSQNQAIFAVLAMAALFCLLMSSCGGGGGESSSPPPSNPVPSITSLTPSSATAGAAAQTLTINGTNFLSSSTVTYNGVAHTATFVSSTQLTISLSASDQATPGSYALIVTNPSPGGGPSNSVNFTVNKPPQPVITSVTPILAQTSQTIVISGGGFGNTPPQTVALSDGSVDTVGCNTTTPSLVISDSGGGKDTWAAGHQTCNNSDAIGVYLVSWTDSQIVLSGFGSALGTTSSSPYLIAAGDPIAIAVTGPNGAGNGVWNTTAVSSTQVATLTVNIVDLPANTPGSVAVTRPNGFNLTLTSSQTITGTEGIYNVTATKVAVGSNTYYATIPAQSATIATGNSATLTVDYYDIVPSTTKVLDQAGMQSLSVSPDGSTLTISSESPIAASLQKGDILASAPTTTAPNGLLDKVQQVTTSGSNIVVTVTPATLAGAVQQAKFSFKEPIGPSSPMNTKKALSGVRVSRKSALPRVSAATPIANPCEGNDLTSAQMYNVTLFQQGPAAIVAGGEIDVCPSIEFDISIGFFQVNSITATATLAEYAQVSLQGSGTESVDEKINVATVEFDSVLVFIGPVPVLLTPTATFFVGASGDLSAGFFSGITQEAQATAGLSYANGQVTPISQISFSAQPVPLSVDASLTLKGYAGVQIGLQVDEIATPYFAPDAYIQFNADINSNPWWTLQAGLEGSVGVDVSILGDNLDNLGPYQVFDYPIATLAQANGGFSISSAAPTLGAITPNTASSGSSGLTLALVGSNFVPDSVVSFNGAPLTTTFVDENDLTALLPAADLVNAGAFPVTVTNPDTAGAISGAVNFTVTASAGNPVPAISSLSPTSLTVGATPQNLTINGTGFLSSSTVTFNGIAHTPTFVSSTQLTISLTASDLATAGTFPVIVTNPAPGGGPSNAVDFTVQPAGAQGNTAILVADSNGQLWRTRAMLGDIAWIGSLPAVMSDIAAYSGTLYGISLAPFGGYSTLYSINPSSGSGTAIGSGAGAVLNALAFSPSGTLYAAGGDSLYTVDPSTGTATDIGSGAYTSSGDLEFDSSGTLYLTSTSNNGDQLFAVNPATGQGTLIGNIGYSEVYGLAYFNGVMYGFTGAGAVISIDLTTGAGTPLTSYNLQFNGATAIAMPTPSSQTLLTDTFTADSSLNTSLWSANTNFLETLAADTGPTPSTYEQPVLAFNGSGMSMSGTDGLYQFTGIQSNTSFTPPFTVQTTVEGTVDYGVAFEPFVISGDLSQYVSLSANLAPDSGYYGMNLNTGALSNDGSGTTLYDGTVNTWYTVTFKFDGNGYAQVTLTDITGNRLNYTTSFYVGKGPFYVVLAQREGYPFVSGPNTAIWQSVAVTTP